MNTLNSKEAYIQMDKAAEEWADCQEKEIILDEGKKALLSKLMTEEQSGTEKVTDKKAENRARNRPEYQQIVKAYALASKSLLKAKLKYNNLDRYSSMKQTEIKTDIKLANRQEG
tara:strand:+ start:169 stop:513 length:345 start_codon:yes stop_codon:yes gene_type:complete